MANGLCSALTKHLVCTKFIARSLKHCTRSMRRKAVHARRFLRRSSGMPSLKVKLKLAVLSWFTRTIPTVSLTLCYLPPTAQSLFIIYIGKSNQKNLGTIKSSNLCTEIIQYSSPEETAVCNLASLALPSFIVNGQYDFQKLHDVTKVVAYNLNRIIDVNYYPIPEARLSNMRHRPIGVGVQGLADTFMALRMPFDSPAAKELNIQIFETIYHGALEASSEMAERDGPYETWMGSPAQLGQLQYDLWGVTPTDLWDWALLKEKIARTGLRNSLLVAPMPTASTSQILGNNECFEPYTRYVYYDCLMHL